jgi:protein CpxP
LVNSKNRGVYCPFDGKWLVGTTESVVPTLKPLRATQRVLAIPISMGSVVPLVASLFTSSVIFISAIKPLPANLIIRSNSKHMKKYMILLAIVCIAAMGQAQTQAQPAAAKKEMKTPDERAMQHTKKMTERYQLDQSQSERLLQVNREHAQNNASFKKEEEASKEERKARREQRKALHQKYLEQVKSIMTAEQFAAFEKDVNDRKAKRAEARKAKKASKG